MPEFYTWTILLIHQLGETGGKQLSVFDSKAGGGGGGANLPLNARAPLMFDYNKSILRNNLLIKLIFDIFFQNEE